ncbi:MAG: CAP domain-containing protein [Lachnospiraceae bacterium]|nr:CAP domain-containing protein [Lachnospiraceae bacterium]
MKQKKILRWNPVLLLVVIFSVTYLTLNTGVDHVFAAEDDASLAVFDDGSRADSINASATSVDVTLQDLVYGQTEARSMLDEINTWRTGETWYWNEDNSSKTTFAAGELSPLEYDYGLEKIAMKRAAELALSYSHTRPDGEKCFTAFEETVPGYTYGYAGENIAYGFPSAESVYMAWREDEDPYSGQGHRRNMLNSNLTRIGIGHCEFYGTDFWVQSLAGNPTGVQAGDANNSQTDVETSVDPSSLINKKLYAFSSDSKNQTLSIGGNVQQENNPRIWLLTNNTPDAGPYGLGIPIKTEGVYFEIADPSVVSLSSDNGMTAIAKGSTNIEALCQFNSETLNDSATITVKGETQSISLPADSYNKNIGDKAFSLNAKAKTKLSYQSSNKKVAIVDENGTVTLKGIGTAYITVTAAESSIYDKQTASVSIRCSSPAGTSLQSLKSSARGALTVSWKSASAATGYEIQYSSKKGFSKAYTKVKTVKGASKKKITFKKLTSKKRYYARVRVYRTVGGKKYYSGWSKVKSVVLK